MRFLKPLRPTPVLPSGPSAKLWESALVKSTTVWKLKALIAKGWVKAKNFEKSSNKIGNAYILTPSGLETKARVTASFLQRKIAEYEKLQKEIETLRQEVSPELLNLTSSNTRIIMYI